MQYKELLNRLKKLKITGISDDSREVLKGDLFVCFNGKYYNGLDFINDAINKGAIAILSEVPIESTDIPCFVLKDLRDIYPKLLSEFYDYPQYELKMIGITGTDGKTTTASIIEYLLNINYAASYIGTNGIRYLKNSEKTKYTTLPLSLLYKTLRLLSDNNINYVVMEVSSQGLVNKRVENIDFDIAIFTNLTQEHLDTHITMENYLEAKKLLFSKLSKNGLAIVNKDSPYHEHFIKNNTIFYSIDKPSDFQATNIRFLKKYCYFDLITKDNVYKDIKTNLYGKYNVYNILASMITALHYKINMEAIIRALSKIPKIDGRLEKVSTNEAFDVYVDFAHTPNAINEVLSFLKTTNRYLTVVLGSAGGKDKSKRPLMGEIATKIADHVIFTSEDPRNEDPLDIILELTSNIINDNYQIIIDRSKAIKKAIETARDNEIIIILGKGNDDYYEENGIIKTYSDIDEVIKNLNNLK